MVTTKLLYSGMRRNLRARTCYRNFGRTCCFYVLWRCRQRFLSKRRLIFTKVHGVAFQKKAIF